MDPYSWALHWDVLVTLAALAAAYYWTQRRWHSGTHRRAAFDLLNVAQSRALFT